MVLGFLASCDNQFLAEVDGTAGPPEQNQGPVHPLIC